MVGEVAAAHLSKAAWTRLRSKRVRHVVRGNQPNILPRLASTDFTSSILSHVILCKTTISRKMATIVWTQYVASAARHQLTYEGQRSDGLAQTFVEGRTGRDTMGS